MNETKFKIPKATCLRCGHTWIPRKETVIKCPRFECGSPYWNKERQKPKEKLNN